MAKKDKSAAKGTTFGMIGAVDVGAAQDDTVLAGLLEELQSDDPTVAAGDAEIIEPAAVAAADDLIETISAEAADTCASVNADAADGDPVDALLEDVANEAALIDAKHEVYAEQGAPEAAGEADAPKTDPEATEGKGKKAKKAKEPKEPKAPKEPRPTSVTHKPGDLLMAKLGTKAGDFLIFDTDADKNNAAVAAFIDRMNDRDAIADKVREKIIMLVTWLASDKGADGLNEVLRRTFTVLAKDKQLTSGDKGNLQLDLLAKPYSIGTARSQANQMFMALPELGLTVKTKGTMVPNEDSIMLAAINAKLGL